MTHVLPQLFGKPFVNDGGLETDLIYHHGLDLPDFAAFPLVDDARGRERLLRYCSEYVQIARRAARPSSWTHRRSGPAPTGANDSSTPSDELRQVNRDAVAPIDRLRNDSDLDSFLISGCLGLAVTATSPERSSIPTTPLSSTRCRSRRSPKLAPIS